jgi:hypothetical protein
MRVRQLVLAALVATTGCLSPVDPSSVRIAAVKVTVGSALATTDTIRVRRTTRVTATAYASQGYDVGITNFSFSSSNDAVATVDQNGVVRGIAPGTAVITARTPQGKSGQVTVVVLTTTVEFTIPIGSAASDIAFSQDYARAYATSASDSLVVIDAFSFFRLRAIPLGLAVGHVAATGDAVFVTNPGADSVTVVSIASNAIVRRIAVAGAPDAVVASPTRAFVGARTANRIVVLSATGAAGSIALAGSPRQLALARTGNLLFATVLAGSNWSLVSANSSSLVTLRSIALPGAAISLTANGDGSRVYVLLATGEVRAYAVSTTGVFTAAGTATAGSGATSIAARVAGPPDVVVSGEPVLILDGPSMTVVDRIAGAGTGTVAIRPDGLFAFIAVPERRTINVVGL